MLRHIFFTLFFIRGLAAFSQNGGTIEGIIFDDHNAIEFVNVALFKTNDTTKIIAYATTDSLGVFRINDISPASYVIQFQAISYLNKKISIDINDVGHNMNLGTILLEIDPTILSAITIQGQKKLIQKTAQGFIVNTAANISQQGGTAIDVLRSTPTISVDAEGGLTLRGKSPLILINGRNSAITNLDQIAASSIESIEVINYAGAKYDANAESGIINIVFKKNKLNGINGAFAMGGGFGAKGRVYSSAIINHKTEIWNLGLAYDNRFAGRTRKISSERTNYFIIDEYLIRQDREDDRLESLQELKMNIDFSPSKRDVFSFEAVGNIEGQDNNEVLNSSIYTIANVFHANNNRTSLELERSKVAEFTLGYNRRFLDERKILQVSASTSINGDKENTDINTQSLDQLNALIGNPFLQVTNNYENENVSIGAIDYSSPLNSSGILSLGYKGLFRSINADFITQDKIDDTYVVDKNGSNNFTFKENVQAVYITYGDKLGLSSSSKWKYEIGLRAEQFTNIGSTENASIYFKNNSLSLFPNANLVYQIKENEFWKLTYGKRTNRPGLGQLNPFIDITDSLNQHSGNPNLKPEIIHFFEMGYSKDWNSTSISSNIYYRHATNTIRQFTELKPNGVSILFPINIGTANTYGIEGIFSSTPTTFYDANASMSIFHIHFNGEVSSEEFVQNAYAWYGKFINNFTSWKGGKLQVIGNYNSALSTPQGKRIANYNIDLGIQQKFGNGNVRLGLVVTDVLNTLKNGFQNNTAGFISFRTSKSDTRAIMLSFAYVFKSSFKEKLLENKFTPE